MLVRRRPQIAKVNARSIDGYFGAGTPCFFIRGTILSDTQVDGEYRTLAIQRPGNLIEIESFDGEWAVVVIKTRAGNRHGDNITARVMLRDADLRSVNIDCAQILAGLGAVEAPAAPPPEFVPWPATVNGNGHANGVAHDVPAEPVAPAEPEPVAVAEPVAAAVAEPVAAAVAEPMPTPVEPVAAPPPPPQKRTPERSPLFGGTTTILDGKFFVEIGASVIAVALPVVLFFLRSLFASGKNENP